MHLNRYNNIMTFFVKEMMRLYLYNYGMMFAEYVSGFELITNPVDLLWVYITCVTFTFPCMIATESLEWTHNTFNHTVSPLDSEIYLIFNGGSAFYSSSKYIYYAFYGFSLCGVNFCPFDSCIY